MCTHRKRSLGLEVGQTLFTSKQIGQKRDKPKMFLNEQVALGFTGGQARTTFTKNGTAVTKFSMATKTSWKDKDSDEWVEKSQWHSVVGYGPVFAALANRLVKGAYVLVQGEHQTRQYDKTIQVPNGNLVIEHVVKATAVELKANTIKILDRAAREEDIATDEPRDDAAN